MISAVLAAAVATAGLSSVVRTGKKAEKASGSPELALMVPAR
jgi:hypothetical protein